MGPGRKHYRNPILPTAAQLPVAIEKRAIRGMASMMIVALMSAADATAADWSGYLSASSDYIYRGVSLVDSGPTVQGGAEGRFIDTFVVGAWAAKIDHQWLYDYRLAGHAEVNVYAGFDFGCGPRCRARLVVTDYLFPGSSGSDWQEATLSVALAERFGASVSYAPRGFGSGASTRTVEGWFVQPLSRELSVSVDAGNFWLGSLGYWYARAGISRKFDRWVVDLSHYWSDPAYTRYGFDDHRTRFVLSASTAF